MEASKSRSWLYNKLRSQGKHNRHHMRWTPHEWGHPNLAIRGLRLSPHCSLYLGDLFLRAVQT